MANIKAGEQSQGIRNPFIVALPLIAVLFILTVLIWWVIISGGNALREQTLSTANLRAR